MMLFTTTMNQMLLLFTFIFIGFLLKRKNLLPEDADTSISRLVNYIFVPALIINTFRSRCTLPNLMERGQSVVVCTVILLISAGVAVLLAPVFSKSREETGIFRYSIAITNFGFMGNALVEGLWGTDMLFSYLVFCLPLNLFVYTVGVIWVTAGKKKFSWKMLNNPMFAAVVIGIVLGLTQLPLPGFLNGAISSASACFSPSAMILTGYVIGKYEFRKLFSQPRIYALTALRMILMPVIFALALRALKLPVEVQSLGLFASAMPLGLNTIVFPVAYGGDATPGASMALISNILGLITVPLLLTLLLPH